MDLVLSVEFSERRNSRPRLRPACRDCRLDIDTRINARGEIFPAGWSKCPELR